MAADGIAHDGNAIDDMAPDNGVVAEDQTPDDMVIDRVVPDGVVSANDVVVDNALVAEGLVVVGGAVGVVFIAGSVVSDYDGVTDYALATNSMADSDNEGDEHSSNTMFPVPITRDEGEIVDSDDGNGMCCKYYIESIFVNDVLFLYVCLLYGFLWLSHCQSLVSKILFILSFRYRVL